MPFIFYENYYKIYTTPWCSLTSLFCLGAVIFVIVVPFFLCAVTGEFWITTTNYYEQPNVKCDAHYILYLLQNGDSRIYNSVTKLNDFYDNLLPVPITKIRSYDYNLDGKVDEFNLKISFKSNPQSIRNLKLMLFFNYTLSDRIYLHIQSIGLVDIDTPYGAAYVKIDGTLNLIQISPISVSTITQTQSEDIFLTATTPHDFITLFNIFTSRNITTKYDFTSFVMPYRGSNETQLDISVKIPNFQSIWVIAPSFYSIKFAWIQYLTIMIPIGILMYLLIFCLLKTKILESTVSNNLPKKQ